MLGLALSSSAKTSLEDVAYLSGTTFALKSTETFTPPSLYLPANYTGKPTYSTSDRWVVKVDENGQITPMVNGEDKAVTITITLPDDANYTGTTLSYQIFYYYSSSCRCDIYSEADWRNFTKNYAEPKYCVVYLHTDLDFFDDADDCMKKFQGYFDGGGHTITVNYNGKDTAPFGYIKHTTVIKNLNIKGRIDNYYGTVSYNQSAPLIRQASLKSSGGTLTIENCHSSVRLVGQGSLDFYGQNPNLAYSGGFIGQFYDGNVVFNDCKSSCVAASEGEYQFELLPDEVASGYQALYDFGGFIGSAGNSWSLSALWSYHCYITFNNCYSEFTAGFLYGKNEEAEVSDIGTFVGEKNSRGVKITTKNCYYTTDKDEAENTNTPDAKSADRLERRYGSLAYKLNAGRSGQNAVWVQDLNSDGAPELKVFCDDPKEVFLQAEHQIKTDDKWITFYYPQILQLENDNYTKYTVSANDDGDDKTLTLTRYNSRYVTNTPLVLYSPTGFDITVPDAYYNDPEYSENLLIGLNKEKSNSAGAYVIDGSTGNFVLAKGTILPANSCYFSGDGKDYTTEITTHEFTHIWTKDEWSAFKSNYSGKKVSVILHTDLSLTNEDLAMEHFIGDLNGMGHTITVDFDGTQANAPQYPCIIEKAEGTIKNLNFTGKVVNGKQSHPSPAVHQVYNDDTNNYELAFENCRNDVAFSGEYTDDTPYGFVGVIPAKTNVTMKDCSFNGNITATVGYNIGTFTSALKGTLALANCYSDLSGSNIGTSADGTSGAGYLWGSPTGTATCTNCYAVSCELPDQFICPTEGVTYVNGSVKNNGMVTYKLNDGRTSDAAVWMQTIGTDSIPQLRTFSKESKEVYYAASGTLPANTASSWGTLYYPVDVTLADNIEHFVPVGLSNDTVLVYESLDKLVPANTPVLIHRNTEDIYEPETMPEIALPEAYYNINDNNTLYGFTGCYTATPATDDMRVLVDSCSRTEVAFAKALTSGISIPQWSCYVTDAANIKADTCQVYNNGVWISSKEEWLAFSQKTRSDYRSRKYTAKLLVPLEFSSADDDYTVYRFYGTFDANGMKIKNTSEIQNIFNAPTGTIKNVVYEGGSPFVLTTNDDNTLIFDNCKTTNAPFLLTAGDNVTFNNCFSNMKDATDNSTDAFIKYNSTGLRESVTVNNSYFLGGDNCTNNTGAVKATDEQVRSGEITYLLNNNNMGRDAKWKQIIGKEFEPQLMNDTSSLVHKIVARDTINTAGWTTLFYPATVKTPAGVTAYKLTGVETTEDTSEDLAVLTAIEGDSIPGYTPVVLCSLVGDATSAKELPLDIPDFYYNRLADSINVDTLQNYILLGTLKEFVAPGGTYVLNTVDGKSTFNKVELGNSENYIQACKCYLYFNTAVAEEEQEGADVVKFFPDSKYTGVPEVKVLDSLLQDGDVYDILGRKVRDMKKGTIYIKNGQKFILR